MNIMNSDYMAQILEWHQSRKLVMSSLEIPYGVGANLEYAQLYSDDPSFDDGHRPVRMFVRQSDGTVKFQGYFCLCGMFVDLEHNPNSYYAVGKCGVDAHFGCEVLLPEGVEAPYLLAENYRDFVKPARTHYLITQEYNQGPYTAEWRKHVATVDARKEIEEFMAMIAA